MKIVVVGAGGLLGRHVVKELRASDQDVVPLTREECDITDLEAVLSLTRDADRIVNCAAYTNVEGAESNEEAAYRANALGPENLARAADRHGSALVHVSTDFVFDGQKEAPYDELDRPAPIGIYARSKWAGEVLARQVTRRVFVVRVQGVYGDGGRNFASRLRDLLCAGTPLRIDGERQVQPTWARTAARQVLAIARTDLFGTYHVSSRGNTTWADFAHQLASRLGVPSTCTSVPTEDLPSKAVRPKNSLFLHRMIELRGLDRMPMWQDDLDAYLERE